MIGFEPRTSGVRSDRSSNWATTTTLLYSDYYRGANFWQLMNEGGSNGDVQLSLTFGQRQDWNVPRRRKRRIANYPFSNLLSVGFLPFLNGPTAINTFLLQYVIRCLFHPWSFCLSNFMWFLLCLSFNFLFLLRLAFLGCFLSSFWHFRFVSCNLFGLLGMFLYSVWPFRYVFCLMFGLLGMFSCLSCVPANLYHLYLNGFLA